MPILVMALYADPVVQAAELRRCKREAQIEGEAFLYKVVDGRTTIGQVRDWRSFFEDVPKSEVFYVLPQFIPSWNRLTQLLRPFCRER